MRKARSWFAYDPTQRDLLDVFAARVTLNIRRFAHHENARL